MIRVSLQLSVVMLGVKDVPRAREFYVDGLGCVVGTVVKVATAG